MYLKYQQYKFLIYYSDKPLTLLYGEESSDLKEIKEKKSNIDANIIKTKNMFGKHHT